MVRCVFPILLIGFAASVVAQRPTESTIPTFYFAEPQQKTVDPQVIEVTVGANVSLACRYEPDKRWSVEILRWHPNKTALPPWNMRRFTPLAIDRKFASSFIGLLNEFSDLRNRISLQYDDLNSTLYFNITNLQFEDAGDFGCVATSYVKVSQYASLSIKVTDKVVFVDMEGNQQQSFEIQPNQQLTETFKCSLYHVYGAENVDAIETAWFQRCEIFNEKGVHLAEPRCFGDPIAGTLVDVQNVTDPYRYGEFWPQTYTRTTIQVNETLTSSFYNKSIGCFARRNSATVVSDFVAIAQPNVDLHLDPINFDCSPHHVTVGSGNTTEFFCRIKVPAYRSFDIYWEVLTPTAGNQFDTVKCRTSGDCLRLKAVTVMDTETEKHNAYVNRVLAKVVVRADAATTAKYKFSLVASYAEGKKVFRSDSFTLEIAAAAATAKGKVDVGAVRASGAACLTGPSGLLSVFTLVALIRSAKSVL